jgi:hypothetical protein
MDQALKQVQEIQINIKEQRKAFQHQLSKVEEEKIKDLAHDLPVLWSTAADKDRKRLLRAAIKEVQLLKDDRDVSIKILWIGGALT